MRLGRLRRDVALAEANLINRRSLVSADSARLMAAARSAATPLRVSLGGLSLGFLLGSGGGPRTKIGNQTLGVAITSTIGLFGEVMRQITGKPTVPPAQTAAGAAHDGEIE